ncbi:MAG: class I SAM-dependent methyltransferase [Phycisphaerae bacterium]
MARKNIQDQLLPTLYADQYLLAVAKPPGIDAGAMPGRRSEGLAEQIARGLGDGVTLWPVNRLSRFESGILLLARDAEIQHKLRADLRAGKMRQEYLAVVLGTVPKGRIVLRSTRAPRKAPARTPGPPKPCHRKADPKSQRQAAGAETAVLPLAKGLKRCSVRCTTNVATTHALRAQLRGARLRLLGDTLHDRSAGTGRAERTCLYLSKLSFKHPVHLKHVALSSPCPYTFSEVARGRTDETPAMHGALVRRLACLEDHATNCYRLLTGRVEGVSGLNVERYGPVLSVEITHPAHVNRKKLQRIVAWYQSLLGIQYVSLFERSRKGTRRRGGTAATRPRGMEAPPSSDTRVMERGLRYVVQFDEAATAGLFLDQRDNRSRVRALAKGKSVLNLFAYTCGFSLAAAAGGAKETVSVDLSARHLEWGRKNLAINHLDAGDHLFVRSDSAEYLRRARRQGKRFDVIVIDAPTFAHGQKRGQSFSFVRDISELLLGCREIAAPGATILVCTNHRQIAAARLKELVRKGIGGKNIAAIQTPPLPVDFAADRDHSKSVLVQLV